MLCFGLDVLLIEELCFSIIYYTVIIIIIIRETKGSNLLSSLEI